MKYTKEQNENSSSIIVSVGPDEELDSMGLGVLSNNRLPGMLPVGILRTDEGTQLRYDIGKRHPVQEYAQRYYVTHTFVLGLLEGIADAFISAEEYMMYPELLKLDWNEIYMANDGETKMVYLPLFSAVQQPDLRFFLREGLREFRYPQAENRDYLVRILTLLSGDSFSAQTLKKLITELKNENITKLSGENSGVEVRPSRIVTEPKTEVQKNDNEVEYVPVKKPVNNGMEIPDSEEDGGGGGVLGLFGKKSKKKEKTPERQGALDSLFSKVREKLGDDEDEDEDSGAFVIPGEKQELHTGKPAGSGSSRMPEEKKPEPKPIEMNVKPITKEPEKPKKTETHPYRPDDGNFGGTVGVFDMNDPITSVKDIAPVEKQGYFIDRRLNKQMRIETESFVIGRSSEDADFRIEDRRKVVSRRHAMILKKGIETYAIIDVYSENHNGTFLNGARLEPGTEYPLKSGDRIRLADLDDFEFVLY